MRGPNKEVSQSVRQARAQGWDVHKTRNNHVAFVNPEGKVVITGSTPSDYRSMANHQAQLKKAGLQPGRHHSPTREARMANHQTAAVAVLEALQNATEPRGPAELSLITNHKAVNVSQALLQLEKRHPEVKRLGRGKWIYKRADIAITVAPPEQAETQEPEEEPVHPACNEHVNGHTNGTNGLIPDQIVLTPAAPSIAVAPTPDRQPITYRPALPVEQPTIFECITVDRNGRPVLRDENGDLWLGVPLKAKF